MLAVKSMKFVNAIPPGVIKDDAAFTSNVIDTALAGGARVLAFAVALGTIDADMAVFKVMQSETQTDATTLGGSPEELVDALDTVTPGDDDDNAIVLVIVDLRQPHARYLQLQATAGNGAAGTYLSCIAFFENVGAPEENVGALAVIEV